MKKILTVYCFLFYTFSCSALAAAYMEQGDYANSNLVLNNIAQLPIMANQVAIHRLAMDLKQQPNGVYTLTSDATNKQKVEAIANDSTMYGYASARAMLNEVFGNHYPELIEHVSQTASRKAIKEETNTIENTVVKEGKLFPNPNDGNMQLRYELADGAIGLLYIYDVAGKLINSYRLQTGNNTLQISEAALESGIYFYQMKINNQVVSSDKLVIIK